MSNPTTSLPPGFRFHPTDEELICHYLRNRAASLPCSVSIIAEVDIYKFDPWDLPAKAAFGEREWYFFSPRDRKYPNGVRPNRAAKSGYWKATGTDKPISASRGNENIGVKKALVFYKGRPPKGVKTDWIMHEYRLAESRSSINSYKPMKLRDSSMRLDDWVLCRIYKKSSSLHSMEAEKEDGFIRAIPEPTQQNNNLKLPKSYSLSELLEDVDYSALVRLLENPSDMQGLEQGPFGNMTNGSSSNMSSDQQLPQTERPVSVPENTLKRHRAFYGCSEDGTALSHPSKKLNSLSDFTSFTTQIDGPQFNLLSQPFLTHQLLLNPQLGLH